MAVALPDGLFRRSGAEPVAVRGLALKVTYRPTIATYRHIGPTSDRRPRWTTTSSRWPRGTSADGRHGDGPGVLRFARTNG